MCSGVLLKINADRVDTVANVLGRQSFTLKHVSQVAACQGKPVAGGVVKLPGGGREATAADMAAAVTAGITRGAVTLRASCCPAPQLAQVISVRRMP